MLQEVEIGTERQLSSKGSNSDIKLMGKGKSTDMTSLRTKITSQMLYPFRNKRENKLFPNKRQMVSWMRILWDVGHFT